jgi:hypothetical protein
VPIRDIRDGAGSLGNSGQTDQLLEGTLQMRDDEDASMTGYSQSQASHTTSIAMDHSSPRYRRNAMKNVFCWSL